VVTSRDLRERLQKELLTNVSLRITDSETTTYPRTGARRIAARDPDRDHAPRRLRVDGGKPEIVVREENGKKLSLSNASL